MSASEPKRWWQSTLGIITAALGLITAAIGLVIAIIQLNSPPSESITPSPDHSQTENNQLIEPNVEELLQLGAKTYDDKRFVRAFDYFRKAAELNDHEAQWHVGEMLFHGEGVNPDTVAGIQWVKRSAERGYASAQAQLGIAYLMGTGVSKNYLEAEKWISRAAYQKNIEGIFAYGIFFLDPASGKADTSKAASYLLKASKKGHIESQVLLGALYFVGSGVQQDQKEGLYWLLGAAMQGNKQVNLFMGSAISRTPSVGKDMLRFAYALLYKAHQLDNDIAIANALTELSEKLDNTEIDHAKNIARWLTLEPHCKYMHGHVVESKGDFDPLNKIQEYVRHNPFQSESNESSKPNFTVMYELGGSQIYAEIQLYIEGRFVETISVDPDEPKSQLIIAGLKPDEYSYSLHGYFIAQNRTGDRHKTVASGEGTIDVDKGKVFEVVFIYDLPNSRNLVILRESE